MTDLARHMPPEWTPPGVPYTTLGEVVKVWAAHYTDAGDLMMIRQDIAAVYVKGLVETAVGGRTALHGVKGKYRHGMYWANTEHQERVDAYLIRWANLTASQQEVFRTLIKDWSNTVEECFEAAVLV